MPPKDTQPPVLLFSTDDGETYKPLGEITEADISALEDPYDPELFHFEPSEEIHLEALVTDRGMRFLKFLLEPPNAWLHLHGYPTRRKRKGTRKEKNYGRRERKGTRKKK